MPGSPGRRNTAFLDKDAGSAPGVGGTRPAEEVTLTMLAKLSRPRLSLLLAVVVTAARVIAATGASAASPLTSAASCGRATCW